MLTSEYNYLPYTFLLWYHMQCWTFHLHFMKASSAVVMQCMQTDDGTTMLLFCLRMVCHCRVYVCVLSQNVTKNPTQC